MRKWLKRIRGAVGMGLTWAIGWGFVGGLLGVLWLAVVETPATTLAFALALFQAGALVGFILGGTFSVVLAMEGRGRAFDEISLLRFTIWGAFGGLLMWAPLALTLVGAAGWSVGGTDLLELALTTTVLALLGAGSAAGTLVLARRADDSALLEHGVDVADIGLTTEEKRELLAG